MSIEAGVDCSCLGADDDYLHMLCSFKSVNDSGMVLKNMESFTTLKLLDTIIKNTKESRKENILNIFEAAGKKSSSNFRFKFWEHETILYCWILLRHG